MKRLIAASLLILAFVLSIAGCDSGLPLPTPSPASGSSSPTAVPTQAAPATAIQPQTTPAATSTQPIADSPTAVPPTQVLTEIPTSDLSGTSTAEAALVSPTAIPPTGLPSPTIVLQSPVAVPSTGPLPDYVRVVNTGGQGVNMRSDPYTVASAVTVVDERTVLRVLGPFVSTGTDSSGQDMVWGHVQLLDSSGRSGYILARFLVAVSGPDPTSTPAPTSSGGDTPTPVASGTETTNLPPGDWSEVVRVPPGKHRIALTFDAGASGETIPIVLQALRERGIHITMFITGKFAEQYPDGVRQMAAEGHEIANHTYSHQDSLTITDQQLIDELNHTDQIIQGLTGKTTRPYWRAPYGSRNRHVLNVAASQGYRSIYWTLDSLDSVGQPKTADFIFNRVTNTPGANLDGAIILQHFGSAASAEALPRELDRLKEMGLQVVTISELLAP